jgi:long-chain acyl-CoA synthetase
MNYGLYAGMELILLPKFDLNEVLETIKQTQPTHFPGVPTMYVAVNAHPRAEEYGVSSIKLCNSGGAAMPVELMRAFEHRFGATICEGYGLSETSPITHANPVTGLRKPGSIGLAMPDTDCKIVDVETGTRELPPGESGELILRGPQVFAGYWQMPEETRNALRELNGETWFYTGDICRTDEDGYVYVTDRKKDIIIAGGFNIYPRDVEEALYLHPAVQEAVVAGVPDAYRGETVKAYVVLRAGQSLTAGQLEAHCREHLAAFKVPRFYEFREALPKSAVGKVLRRVLQEEERRKLAMAD